MVGTLGTLGSLGTLGMLGNLDLGSYHQLIQASLGAKNYSIRSLLWDFEVTTDLNQIRVVASMCTTLDTSFIFTKESNIAKCFLISVMLIWHTGIKIHEIMTFKVNFLCQKTLK